MRALLPSTRALRCSCSPALLALLTTSALCGCTERDSTPKLHRGADSGALSDAGDSDSGDSGDSGTGVPIVPLPVPPGPGDLPPPSGTGANLRVLPWAGFSAGISYTFDDSQPSQVAHWPEIKAEGIRVTFYINSANNYISGYDGVFQDAIAEGDEIGNHTVHHCRVSELAGANLTACPNGLASAEQEIDECTAYIQSPLGQSDVWTMAYPYGDTAYKPAAKDRFFLGRGVASGTVGANDATDPFNLPILAGAGDPTVPGGDPVSLFNGNADTAVAQGRWIIYLFHSILPTLDNWYAGEDISAITGSIEYAKGLGTVWLDSVVDIGAYWLGQRTLQGVTPATAGATTTWTWSLPAHFPPGHLLRVAVDGGTLSQGGHPLSWDGHGYYEVALDAGTLSWSQ